MSVSWDFFAKRRLKNNNGVRAWADYRNIISYEGLVEALNTEDVSPPSREEVNFLFEDPLVLAEQNAQGLATKRFIDDGNKETIVPSSKAKKAKKVVKPKKTKKVAKDKSPRDYGVYRAADQSTEEKP